MTEISVDFIRELIAEDIRKNKNAGRVHTRFPPEPNGYLHIGHAKSILLNYGLAQEFKGKFNLRYDDTNPEKEEQEYVDAMKRDLRWLGVDWEDREFYASDYFEQLNQWAEQLIKSGKAFVCDLTADEVSEYRGKAIVQGDKVITPPGKESPYRNRSIEENLNLFTRMRAGEFPDGAKTLRAKIDMAHPNLNLRDPVMYRIRRVIHHRTGDKWCIYPSYDWAHGQCDSIEGITHSICTLEFEDHRPLYDWFIENLGIHHPQQIEFARFGLAYTTMSKRWLLHLVKEKFVRGWDDPRMPTISALRRRGYTPEAIRDVMQRVGVTRKISVTEYEFLEYCLRQDLNKRAPRAMAVLDPLKIVITNYPENQTEEFEAVNNPEDSNAGTRKVPFSKVLYIEREDFMESPTKDFFRLAPGKEVRLRYACLITCDSAVKDTSGKITELNCTYDPNSRGGEAPDGRKVKATLHWVSAQHAKTAEVRLYDHLFTKANPMDVAEGENFLKNVNPHSLTVLRDCKIEPSLASANVGARFQFERKGYFCVDPDSTSDALVFNRTVTLRDEWAKLQKGQKK